MRIPSALIIAMMFSISTTSLQAQTWQQESTQDGSGIIASFKPKAESLCAIMVIPGTAIFLFEQNIETRSNGSTANTYQWARTVVSESRGSFVLKREETLTVSFTTAKNLDGSPGELLEISRLYPTIPSQFIDNCGLATLELIELNSDIFSDILENTLILEYLVTLGI